MANSALKFAIDRVSAEKKSLKCEEKAIQEALAKLRSQLTQLQVESLEIRARARQQEDPARSESQASESQANTSLRPEVYGGSVEPTKAHINTQELQLSVDASSILEKMMQGRFECDNMSEEEDDDEEN